MSFFNKKGLPINKIEIGTKKIKKSSDVGKLEEKINQENSEIKETLIEIGKLYYELYKNDSHEKLVPLCNVVDESYRIIGLCEKQIMLLQGVQLCPNCKAHVSLDSLFCNKCGTKIDSLEDDNSLENIGSSNSSKLVEPKLESIKCRECGSNMPGDTVFCTNCGAKIK